MSNMSGRLAGKTAIISGGASGCGAAAAQLFAREGAKVAIVDRNIELARGVAAEIRDQGGAASAHYADVAKQAEVMAVIAEIQARYGDADILFNHAGTLIVKPFLEIQESEWDWLMGVNVKSMFLMTQAVLPQMLS